MTSLSHLKWCRVEKNENISAKRTTPTTIATTTTTRATIATATKCQATGLPNGKVFWLLSLLQLHFFSASTKGQTRDDNNKTETTMHIRKMRHEKFHGNEDSEERGGGGGTVWGRAGRNGALVVADAVDKFFLKVKWRWFGQQQQQQQQLS